MENFILRTDIEEILDNVLSGNLAYVNSTDDTLNKLVDVIGGWQVIAIRLAESKDLDWSLPITPANLNNLMLQGDLKCSTSSILK